MFAIMRTAKIKTLGSLAGALSHCYRERYTPNADPERAHQNHHMVGGSVDAAMGLARGRLPEKRRKDAVIAIEYLIGASPEFFETASTTKKQDFFKAAGKWLQEKHGLENIITASIHNDETTPHLSVFVVPITKDGRLSAKDFLNGRQALRDAQTSFAKAVEHLGLERGIEGSKATHERVKSHYAAINRAAESIPQIEAQEIKGQPAKGETLMQKIFGAVETPEGVADRLNNKILDAVQPIAEKAAITARSEREARQLRETMVSMQKRLKTLEEPFKGLSPEQKAAVLNVAAEIQQDNALKQAQRTRERDAAIIEKSRQRGMKTTKTKSLER